MGLLDQAINYVANIDYSTLVLKGIYKTAEFIVVNGYEIIKWANK